MSAPNPWLELIAYNTADPKMKRTIRAYWIARGSIAAVLILIFLWDAIFK